MLLKPIVFFICLLCFWVKEMSHLCASEIWVDPKPLDVIPNLCSHYTLINSVDFHPKKNLFCVTYTHCNKVVLYKINGLGMPEWVQTLSNPWAKLSEPQHAIFSSDGEKIIVANWTNQTLTIYHAEKSDFFRASPAAIILSPAHFEHNKPHGIAISPCGNFLAIAYGASNNYGKAIALFHITKEGVHYELASVLQTEELPGIPKGITFSPDGDCLLVTFSDANSVVLFDLDRKTQTIRSIPRQTIQGPHTQISRPEDVKISPDGNYCVITNSDQHTVTFYPFDKISNFITQSTPIYVLQNPEAHLCFPHGIAFSPDGSCMLITQFGPIQSTEEGEIFLSAMLPNQSYTNLYKIVKK